MKVLGAILIISGCGSVGFYIAFVYNRELALLKKFAYLLDYMTCQLQFKLMPLPALLRDAAKQAAGFMVGLFQDLADELDTQVKPDVKSCLLATLNKYPQIPASVRCCLCELSGSLGKFDLEGQMEGFAYTKSVCLEKIAALEENRESRLRTYRTLGICAGAALAVIFV